jgi:hypothetical protein
LKAGDDLVAQRIDLLPATDPGPEQAVEVNEVIRPGCIDHLARG